MKSHPANGNIFSTWLQQRGRIFTSPGLKNELIPALVTMAGVLMITILFFVCLTHLVR
ncbi:MAG: hypothetical protein INR69_08185 [Mucilaginibacter polytrichastri]|nr:hypothetical protein [Mucilaginibacter polytrichastri]